MKTRGLLLLFGVLCSLLWSPAEAAATYHVVRIIDGDTFDATDGTIRFRVRIAGIDAPEKGAPFATHATAHLRTLIADRAVTLAPVASGMDRYHRVLAQVHMSGGDVGVALIIQGLAAYWRPGCRDYVEGSDVKYDYDPRPYVAAEATARAAKRRMWGKGAGWRCRVGRVKY